jgi:hypothetical protein
VEAVKQLSGMAQELLGNVRKQAEPRWEMQSHLLQRLSRGQLQAMGIRTKPDLGERPEPIPAFMFDGAKVGWAKSTVENYGRRFEGVSVTRSETDERMPGEPAASTLKPPVKRLPGRQSKEAEIRQAISGLQAKGTDLASQPRPKAYELIREYARDQLGANISIGYSDPVLQRVLLRLFGSRA